ncbi:hypothetical protein C1H46_011801 [Malus baccata]|uniref:Uncharacterized protein n=1 Tax=Malus baccata TaxID=106549 RepID=A0A540MUT9_MALBA|nr:hypothetical protein C1H46_011801 [Malus baccata]
MEAEAASVGSVVSLMGDETGIMVAIGGTMATMAARVAPPFTVTMARVLLFLAA